MEQLVQLASVYLTGIHNNFTKTASKNFTLSPKYSIIIIERKKKGEVEYEN